MCLFAYLSACLFFKCLDYSRTNEQIFIKNVLWVGAGQRKKLPIWGKDLDHISDTKIHEYSEVPFSMYFDDSGFLLNISSKAMNKF